MKVDAIGKNYATKNAVRVNNSAGLCEESKPIQYTKITFKGGNNGHVLHVVAECKPFNQAGGVATVVEDYKRLNNVSATEKGQAVFVTPFYNGLVKYSSAEGTNGLQKESVDLPRVPNNLPEGHPLKGKEGQPLYIKADLSKNNLEDILKSKKDYWLLEEVANKEMSWGMQEKAPVKLLRVAGDADGKPLKDNIFMVFTEATAYDPAPYSLNQYSSDVKQVVKSWAGDPYAKFDKAVVECMEDISRSISGFDPGTVVCSDSQAAYVTHYMAKKNAAGVEYFKGKKPMQIGHNLGDGYIGLTSARNMAVNLDLLTPKEWNAVIKSKKLRDAIITGGTVEEDFFAKFVKNINAHNKLSAMSIPVHYAKSGYLQSFGVVSQGYLDEITTNKEIAPVLFEDMIELKKMGVAVGLTNPHNGNETAFTKLGLAGYNSPQRLKLADGTEEIIEPMKMFTEADKATLTLEKVNELKRENKKNFLKRFLPKYDTAKVFNEKNGSWINSGSSIIRAGMEKDMTIVNNSDIPKYLSKLEKGENVNVIVSWGRGDFQKAFDEVLNGFKKYVTKTGDKESILVLGGDLATSKNEGQKVKDIAELLSKDELFKGRVMLLDGFAPGMPMALMGDTAIFTSRTAPCELTDLEAKKMLCTPIVSNGQGLGQKNFDPDIVSEASMADAYKTKHQYFMSREDALKDASTEAQDSFNKVFNKIKKNIEVQYKVAVGKPISPEKLELFLQANEEYNDALRKLRDEVMSDDIAQCLERKFVKHSKDDVAKTILRNQAEMKTGWENNEKITRSEKPTGELYRSQFKKQAKNVSEKDVIKHGLDAADLTVENNSRSIFERVKSFISKNKKAAYITGGVAVIAGLGFAGYKAGWLNPKYREEKKNGHLSCVS